MPDDQSTVARAFELARSGRFANLDEIQRELQKADYPSVVEHLSGPTMKRQLKALIKSSRAVPEG